MTELPGEQPPPPPPSPAERADAPPPPDGRPRRTRLVLWIAAAVVVVAVPIVLAVIAALSAPTDDDSAAEAPADAPDADGPDAEAEGPDADEAPEDLVGDLDPDALSGRDEQLARLLIPVDASERAMIAFQDEIGRVLTDHASEDPQQLIEELRGAAAEGGAALADVRPSLVESLDEPAVDDVRVVYLAHHDVWADYMEAVEEDPAILGDEEGGARWTVAINSSAEAFARALREELDADLDPEVRGVAEEILARGFDRSDLDPDA